MCGGGPWSSSRHCDPFKGEDFALFLRRLPGTYAILGVRAPGAGIETGFPHLGTFTPDERAIGHGVRAMAGWLARRTSGNCRDACCQGLDPDGCHMVRETE